MAKSPRLLPGCFPIKTSSKEETIARERFHMRLKAILVTVLFAILATSTVFAATRFVNPAIGVDGDDCLGAGMGPGAGTACATIAFARSVADQGDTILLAIGTYPEGEIDITLSFITISGPLDFTDISPVKPGAGVRMDLSPLTCDPTVEACIDAGSFDYAFSIEEDNITIEGLAIEGDDDTFALIQILGGYDRWEIGYNWMFEAGQKFPSSVFNHSYGVYGDSQTSDGTVTMTGNEIHNNLIFELGRQALTGANTTAGMGLRLEGIEGQSSECNDTDKFDCGVWIHDNEFSDLATGQNSLNFSFDVNGKEPSVGITVNQDPETDLANNGAVIEDNTYDKDSVDGDQLDFGVVIEIGDSQVNEDNINFTDPDVDVYVVNINRAATIDELALASFFKSLNPDLLGPGSDSYFRTETLAKDNSADDATIVNLDETATVPDLFTITVIPQGSSASYKVSLDSDGDLNLRQGARLLFDGVLSDGLGGTTGITDVVLGGTEGNDLLTIDFRDGNPIPLGDGAAIENGIDFDGEGGFDAIAIRGDAQSDYETIEMTDSDGGTISFEPSGGAGLAPTGFVDGTTSKLLFDNIEPIDDVVIVNIQFSLIAPDETDNEINIIGGPFRYGFDTFQINSGAEKTFEEVNFANKKHVYIFGSDDTGGDVDGEDIFTVFTPDGEAPELLLDLFLFGGDVAANDDLSDDFFVIRPSADFPIHVDGGSVDMGGGDFLFLDCADTVSTCDPSDILAIIPGDGDTDGSYVGFEGGFLGGH